MLFSFVVVVDVVVLSQNITGQYFLSRTIFTFFYFYFLDNTYLKE